MGAKLLQLNFTFDASPADYEAMVTPLAEAFGAVSGLRWKIWMMNPDARQAGGIYMFEDGAAVGEFLDGPLAGQVKTHPAIGDLSAKVFDVMEGLSLVTRGPFDVGARVSGRNARVSSANEGSFNT